jgi:hypothetical protein
MKFGFSKPEMIVDLDKLSHPFTTQLRTSTLLGA